MSVARPLRSLRPAAMSTPARLPRPCARLEKATPYALNSGGLRLYRRCAEPRRAHGGVARIRLDRVDTPAEAFEHGAGLDRERHVGDVGDDARAACQQD